MFKFYQLSQYYFIICNFSHPKHLVKHSFHFLHSFFFYKGTQQNFYLHNLSEVFKRWYDEPVKFAFSANNQGLNSLRIMEMLFPGGFFFSDFFCVWVIKYLTHSFQKNKKWFHEIRNISILLILFLNENNQLLSYFKWLNQTSEIWMP